MSNEIKPWCEEDLDNPNKGILVAIFLTTSYIYYVHPELCSIIQDELFDTVCLELIEHWDDIEHQHKHLIDYGNLEAGTGFNLKEHDYPTVVKVVAMKMVEAL